MPRPSSLARTTAAPATPPAVQPTSPPPASKRRGNPNLARIPRCGARTRAGCPCCAPAIHGKLRCRMHGGRSTGPGTEEGRARVAAARTTHGKHGSDTRAPSIATTSASSAVAACGCSRCCTATACRPNSPLARTRRRRSCRFRPGRPAASPGRRTVPCCWRRQLPSPHGSRPWRCPGRQGRQTAPPGPHRPACWRQRRQNPLHQNGRLTRLPRRRLPSPRQRSQNPMHQFGRLPPVLLRDRCRGAPLRRWRPNPKQQNAPHAGQAARRRRPGWRRCRPPQHQFVHPPPPAQPPPRGAQPGPGLSSIPQPRGGATHARL